MASSNEKRTYRHTVTGKVGVFPVSFAQHFPALVGVEDDAKPLAYVPISTQAIDDLRDGDDADDENEPESTEIEEVN